VSAAGVRLREATAADLPAIARVFVDAWRAGYASMLEPDVVAMWDDVTTIERLMGKRLARNGEATILALDDDDAVTGFASFGPDPDEPTRGEIHSVYVAPASARRGIGKALVLAAVEALQARGFATVSLWRFEANKPARALYASLGFAHDGRRRVEPEFRAPEVAMVRPTATATKPAPADEVARLATEQVRPEFADLDLLGPADLVTLMAAESRRAPEAVIAAQASIALAVAQIAERMDRGGRLIYVGAGSAGRLGVLDAAESGPTFDTADGQIVGLIAGGDGAMFRPVEAAEDREDGALEALERLALTDADTVVGITASGRTPYVIGALDWARGRGALTVAVACNRDAAVSRHADIAIELEVGPEVIAGSTRLNASTAQKITLNILSTAAMVRLGRTYGNRMVHMRATNAKLRARAVRMVAEVTGAEAAEAEAALAAADWETKTAIAMLSAGVDAPTARAALEQARGRLRAALEALRA
jgi:N-acetylmuramic acid 6-phosphate etherase